MKILLNIRNSYLQFISIDTGQRRDMVAQASTSTIKGQEMIKLISLNVERLRHRSEVFSLLAREQPDVVCLQELPESEISDIEQLLGMECSFAPMGRHPKVENRIVGLATFAGNVRDSRSHYYAGSKHDVQNSVPRTRLTNHPLLIAECYDRGKLFRIANTHFPWSANGQPDENQWSKFRILLDHLTELEDFVFVADLNAPRGGPIFDELARRYTDWIPPTCMTSIDPKLHRAGALPLMVDCLFTTDHYYVAEIKMEFGVSDHAAIIATLEARP